MDDLLAILTMKKERGHKLLKPWMREMFSQRTYKYKEDYGENHDLLYANKLNNLHEIDKLLRRHKLQEELYSSHFSNTYTKIEKIQRKKKRKDTEKINMAPV